MADPQGIVKNVSATKKGQEMRMSTFVNFWKNQSKPDVFQKMKTYTVDPKSTEIPPSIFIKLSKKEARHEKNFYYCFGKAAANAIKKGGDPEFKKFFENCISDYEKETGYKIEP